MSKPRTLTIEEIRRVYAYDPATGFLFSVANGVLRRVGRVDKRGYLRVTMNVDGELREVLVHRIAYAIMTGIDLSDEVEIDHINRDKGDNRWENIRLCTHQENIVNSSQPRSKFDLPRGVYANLKSRVRPYRSKIQVAGKSIYIGSFRTIEEAKAAYDAECKKHFGEFYTP